MATFKVGDRVRVTRAGHIPSLHRAGSVGAVAAIGERPGWRICIPWIICRLLDGPMVTVMVDHIPSETFFIPTAWLRPLTPPAEDTWAADKVREVTKPQHMEPVAPEEVRERQREFDRMLGEV